MTTSIDQLYAALKIFQEQNIAIPQEMIDQIEQREKSVLENEILPDLQVTLEKILGKLTKPLLLLVDYVPGDGLAVKVATRRKFSDTKESVICSDGENVEVVNGTNGKYLRSDSNNRLTDNLGHLIDFDWIAP